MKRLALLLAAAHAFWFLLFSPWTRGSVGFWPLMIVAVGVLVRASWGHDGMMWSEEWRWRPRDLVMGAVSAGVLYGLFAVGYGVVTRIFPWSAGQVSDVYAVRGGMPLWAVSLTLAVWIGPGEEIFWRGYLQDVLCRRFGRRSGLALAVVMYGSVHLWSGNAILVLAAVVCGAFWGGLFLYERRVWPVIISHALWDLAIFVVAPIGA